MIDFVVVSDLQPHVLESRVEGGAEPATDHHLVLSWLWWWARVPVRPSLLGVKELQRSHSRELQPCPGEGGGH